MDLIGRHRRDRDDHDWTHRRGRYEGLDPDTADRPQVRPVERPERERQTHNVGADGVRQREADDDGTWRPGGDDGD